MEALQRCTAACFSTRSLQSGVCVSPGPDELFVAVFDPSNGGGQPFGKQSSQRMYNPGGDTYTTVSGIWLPVWMEVPLPPRHTYTYTHTHTGMGVPGHSEHCPA